MYPQTGSSKTYHLRRYTDVGGLQWDVQLGYEPRDVTLGPTGEVYVTDPANDAIQVYRDDGTWIHQVTCPSPWRIQVTHDDLMIVSDLDDTIRVYTRRGRLLRHLLTHTGSVLSMALYEPSYLAVSDGSVVYLYDIRGCL